MDQDDYVDILASVAGTEQTEIDFDDDLTEFDDEPETEWPGVYDEPWDGFRDDVEADADVLRSAGWGTDEDYGHFDGFYEDY